jgi:hypothetical protein
VTDTVTLQVGGYSVVIPQGSFKQTFKGGYVYEGRIGGAALEARIVPVSANTCRLTAEASGANLAGTTHPITVGLTIGDDSGTTTADRKTISRRGCPVQPLLGRDFRPARLCLDRISRVALTIPELCSSSSQFLPTFPWKRGSESLADPSHDPHTSQTVLATSHPRRLPRRRCPIRAYVGRRGATKLCLGGNFRAEFRHWRQSAL